MDMQMEVTHDLLKKSLIHNYTRSTEFKKLGGFVKIPPLHIWGASGIGKSQITREVAMELAGRANKKFIDWNSCPNKTDFLSNEAVKSAFIFADVRLSQLDPTDLRGLPDLFQDNSRSDFVSWKPALLFKILSLPSCSGLLFFDEMNLAPPAVQAACYQIILDGGIGEITLSPLVHVVAAGNRIEDQANVFEMAGPLKKRFGHVTLQIPDEKTWSAYAVDKGLDARVIGFINLFPSLLHDVNQNNKEQYATPNPRGWEFVSNMIVGVDDPQFLRSLVCQPVGYAAGVQFSKFAELETMELTVDDLLKDPTRIKAITRADIQWVLISGIAERYRSDKNILPKALKVVGNLNPDFSVHLLRLMKGIGKESFQNIMVGKAEYREILKRYVPYMVAITD
jgi:hypothetical protein